MLATLFLSGVFALTAHASNCNLSKTSKLNCELKWSEGKDKYRLQLLIESDGCTARDPESNKCANFRLCKDKNVAGLGATSLTHPNASPVFCTGEKVIDLFVSDQKGGPKAYVECENGKPKHIRLMAPDSVQTASATTKICKFPLWITAKKKLK